MRSKINGCGPKGLVGKLVPDNLLGVSVLKACNTHDQNYSHGGNDIDRQMADEQFLANMLTEVEGKSKSKFVKTIRKLQAYLYFWSVRIFGNLFFDSKDEHEK